MERTSARRGFTLIELLLVIGIIAILASIVIVAVNPSKQLGDARNAQRRADINALLNAVYQYYIDKGSFPPANGGITSIPTISGKYANMFEICGAYTNAVGACPSGSTGVRQIILYGLTGSYIVGFPHDPKLGWSNSSEPTLTNMGYNGAANTATYGHAINGSDYWIGKDANNRITIVASGAEISGVIAGESGTIMSVSR